MLAREFELYRVSSGFVTIDDPVKMRILHYLGGEERGFGDIVRALRKAKSTVSYHLLGLEEHRLVRSRLHPESRREKIYSRTGDLLMAVRPGSGRNMAVTFTDLWTSTFQKESPPPGR